MFYDLTIGKRGLEASHKPFHLGHFGFFKYRNIGVFGDLSDKFGKEGLRVLTHQGFGKMTQVAAQMIGFLDKYGFKTCLCNGFCRGHPCHSAADD